MLDSTKVQLVRLACGAGILITSMVTGYNSNIQNIALFLLGVPFEVVTVVEAKTKAEAEKAASQAEA